MPRTFVGVIAAAAAAAFALSGCGPAHLGTAAITGDQRISTSTLSDEVANLQNAYQAGRAKIQLQFPPAEAPQQVLGWLLRFKIRDQLAARNHISVSSGESGRALSKLERQTGRTGPAFKQLAVANGLPPDLLPALGRFEAIQNVMLTRLDGGTAPKTSARVQALTGVLDHRQCVAAKTLNIQVNPQFGQFDYGTLAVIPATSQLSAPTAPAPARTPKPQLSPPC